MLEVQHSIRVAARKSGLSAHVIRAWERRYNAVSPERTDTNRRLYSDGEIERLSLLRAATHAGHSISHIAKLPVEKLRELVADAPPPVVGQVSGRAMGAVEAIAESIRAIEKLDAIALEDTLGRAAVALGQHGLLQKIIGPLAQKIGDLWRAGDITASHEHFASASIRNFLIRNARPFAQNESMATIIVVTPAGQLHEIGAVMVGAAANDMGWRVIYLGTNLPAAEIAGAAVQNRARAIALSIVYPEDDPNLPAELETLRKRLPADIQIIAGGRAAASYGGTLDKIGARRPKDLQELYQWLERLRAPNPAY